MITILLQCCPDTAAIAKCIHEYEAATNDNDLQIFNEICGTVVLVAVIVMGGFLLWKLIDHIANGIRSIYKRSCDKKDYQKRQEADLKDKLLSFLETSTSTEEYNKEAGKVMKKKKDENSTESQYYINVLKSIIKDDTIPKQPSHEN